MFERYEHLSQERWTMLYQPCLGFNHVADFGSPLRNLLQGIPKSSLFQTQDFLQSKICMTQFSFMCLGLLGCFWNFLVLDGLKNTIFVRMLHTCNLHWFLGFAVSVSACTSCYLNHRQHLLHNAKELGLFFPPLSCLSPHNELKNYIFVWPHS